jgi:hypothetical protein
VSSCSNGSIVHFFRGFLSFKTMTWVLPGEINAMENCARCYGGLTTLSGEVDVRLIALLSLFGRTEGRVGGGKAGRLT